MGMSAMAIKIFTLIPLSVLFASATVERARDNGDIYVVDDATALREHQDLMPTEENFVDTTTTPYAESNPNLFNFDEIMAECNSSFSIPMAHYIAFNTTGELPNTVDKTGMCFVRCFYEKSGIMENWKLNEPVIKANIWPSVDNATAEMCQEKDAKQGNACVRTYAIAKCLTERALAVNNSTSS